MYTREELKELVAYCAERGIEVIPEIDMPGHNQALAAAYPEILLLPGPQHESQHDRRSGLVPGLSAKAGSMEILRGRF